ncbi:DUF4153 domain-containing protein [Spirillospora sp. NPDC050679]
MTDRVPLRTALAVPAPPGSRAPGARPPGPPPPPTWPERLFLEWKEPRRAFGPLLLGGVAAAGVAGAVFFGGVEKGGRLGLNVPLTALAAAAVVLPTAWSAGRIVKSGGREGGEGEGRRVNRTGVLFSVLALALAATAAYRDAVWLVVLTALLALPIASYAMTGGRSWLEVVGGGLALPPALGRLVPWAARGAAATASAGRGRVVPVLRTGLVAAALLLVFGALFAQADAAFSRFVGGLFPDVSPGPGLLRLVVLAGTAALTLGLAFLALAPPPLRKLAPARPAPAGRWTWAVPIAALDLLFAAFCAIQANVLLASDKDRVLASTGLTYAEYARQGFFQLVIATVLVLAVLAYAVRHAPLGSRADRATVRALLGALCAFTLVIVAVALRRLYLYEETFGWTRLRLWVHAFELWLGLVVVLVAAAGLRLKASWLPRAVAASGAAGLLALSALNPDAFIAERNVVRFEDTGKIDLYYLRDLSADAGPALNRLPEPQRSCALRDIAARVRADEPVWAANLSRHHARDLVERRPVVSAGSQPC